jgi:hypothetical protein
MRNPGGGGLGPLEVVQSKTPLLDSTTLRTVIRRGNTCRRIFSVQPLTYPNRTMPAAYDQGFP